MKCHRFAYAVILSTLFATVGCGAAAPPTVESPAAMAAPAPQPVLARSLYTKDATGALSENDLQTILASPIDLQFPARVGVVAVPHAFDPQGDVSISTRSTASRDFARALTGHPFFSHVSDISTDLPNGGGLEGLRVIAARYRLRYLLLYSEHLEDATHLNGWAWLYPTVIGMFLLPGVTVASRGFVQADMLDVRTGTILFSVIQPMQVSEQELMIGAARSHKDYQAEAFAGASKALAKHVGAQTNALVAFADAAAKGEARAQTRILPAPIADNMPPRRSALTAVAQP